MNDIDKIKHLLFGHEKKALDAITRRLETPETRTADVADVLPEAIARSHTRDDRLAKALAEPIEQGLKDSIRRDPTEIADALFPVMGPAIRKAIAETLKSMVQAFNRALDSSLSPRVRFEAWRAGVPLGEYVLQKSLIYRVEQAYLIKPDNGLLVASVFHESVAARKDEDAVSAMFTAIEDFVKDSFSQDHSGSLETADMGDYTLWAVHGPEAVLVCVIRGVAPLALRSDLQAVLERIHLRYGDALADYCGDRDSVAGVELELEQCLAMESHKDAGRQGRLVSPALIVVAVLLVAGLVWLSWSRYQDSRELAAVQAALAAADGVVATRLARVDGRLAARGLRDPLARPLDAIIADAGVDPATVDVDFTPYQSLAESIVEQRATQVLAPPAGVTLSLRDGVLVASGSASGDWVREAAALTRALAGVSGFDASGLAPADDALLAAARAALSPPETVALTMSNARLIVAGVAPLAWTESVDARLATIDGLASVDTGALVVAEQADLDALLRRYDGFDLYFDEGVDLTPTSAAPVDTLAASLLRIGELAGVFGATPKVAVTGHADGTGTPELNARLMMARATAVADALVARGVPAAWLDVRRGPDRSPGPVDPLSRRVTISPAVSAPPAPGGD